MSGADKTLTEFSNCALIQDETLLTICQVLEDGWPAGPTFLHALNTLIEAVVVHEKVYFDPLHQLGRTDESPYTVPGILRNSDFVGFLIREGAICEFPDESVVNDYLLSRGREYSYTNFVLDAYWSTDSFAYGDPAGEAKRIELYIDLVSKAARLLEPREITPFLRFENPEQGEVSLMEPDALVAKMLAKSIDLSEDDVKTIEGLNFRSKVWYAGPDIVASILLGGKIPRVTKAVRMQPSGQQKNLRNTNLAGMVPIDPRTDDFFVRVIEQRNRLKRTNRYVSDFLKVIGNSGKSQKE
jgi:hypothetical protein